MLTFLRVPILTLCLLCLINNISLANTSHLRFELIKGVDPAYIVIALSEQPGVMAAAKDLQRDITKITGVTPNIVHTL